MLCCIVDTVELEKKYRDLEKSLNSGAGDAVSDSSSDQDDDNVEVIEEEEEDPLYCVGCEKRFKSFPAMRNHVQSKQHKKNMEFLRAELEEEEDLDGLEKDLDGLDVSDEAAVDLDHFPETSNPLKEGEKTPLEDSKTSPSPAEEETVILADATPVIEVEEYTSRSKSKKDKKDKLAKKKVEELGLKCAVCREVFPTRNKLFQHVKAENHAILK